MTLLSASSSRAAASRLARVANSTSTKIHLPSSQNAINHNHTKFFLSTDTNTSSTTSSLTFDDVTDSNGLLQFKTLHEMNTYASIAFKDNELFGTYQPPKMPEENVVKDKVEDQKGTFNWMTYGEYGMMIDRCRTVLKDIGKCDDAYYMCRYMICSIFSNCKSMH